MFLGDLTMSQKISFMILAEKVMTSDNVKGRKEKAMIDSFFKEMNLSKKMVETYEQSYDETLELLSKYPKSANVKMYIELVALAFVDNKFVDEEVRTIDEIRSSMGLSSGGLTPDIDEEEIFRLIQEYTKIATALQKIIKKVED